MLSSSSSPMLPNVPQSNNNSVVESKRISKSHNVVISLSSKGEGGRGNITTSLKTTTSLPFKPCCGAKKMTQKSLDMCTEVLGCETGQTVAHKAFPCNNSDGEGNYYLPTSRDPSERFWTSRIAPGVHAKGEGSVPPPLSSMVGGNCVRVSRCMENGMFVLKATIEQTTPFLLVTREFNSVDRSINYGGPRLLIRSFSSKVVQRHEFLGPHPEVEDETFEIEVDEVERKDVDEDIKMDKVDQCHIRLNQGCKEKEIATLIPAICDENRPYRAKVNAIRCW